MKEFWLLQADEHEKEQARKESFDRTTIMTTSEPTIGPKQSESMVTELSITEQ